MDFHSLPSDQGLQVVEDEKERLNRKLIELLNELRVALPGVQVLFAFLLILPFTQAFDRVSDLQRGVYFAAFLAATVASALLIGPSAYHRIRWRYPELETVEEKRRMLLTSNRLAIGGIVFLGMAMTGVVLLISDVLFGVPAAAGVSAGAASVFVWFWYLLPLLRRVREGR